MSWGSRTIFSVRPCGSTTVRQNKNIYQLKCAYLHHNALFGILTCVKLSDKRVNECQNIRNKTQAAVYLGPCVKQVIQLICVNLEEGEANLKLQILGLQRVEEMLRRQQVQPLLFPVPHHCVRFA